MKRNSLIFIIILLALCMIGCKNNNTEINNGDSDPDEGKEIINISVDKNTIPEFIDIDEFDLSIIKIIVEYSDGTTRLQDLKESFIESDVLEYLKKGGSKRVTITYKEDFACTANIQTKDFGAMDPKIDDHDATILITRDKNESNLLIKVLSSKGISSLQCTFSYNSLTFDMNLESLKTLDNYDVRLDKQENKITVLLIAKNTSLLIGENTILSIKYTGNYRDANFMLDDASTNRILRFENDELLDVNDAYYFYSLK